MSNSEPPAQEAPKVLSRHALGARRILGDTSVQALYAELEAQFLSLAINGDTAELRERNRVNLQCIQGLFTALQDIARNQLPPFLREKEDQIVRTGDGSTTLQ